MGNYVGPSQQTLANVAFVFALFVPLVGLILSIIALSGMKKHRNVEGRGFAMAGLIISIAWFAVACVWFIVVVAIFGAAAAAGSH